MTFILALTLILAASLIIACEGPMGPQGEKGDPGALLIEKVSFTGLTANGSAEITTTMLTLTFNQDLAGLSANDITIIDPDDTRAVKGSLTGTGTGVYNLSVLGIKKAGVISVVASRNGFVINPVYYSVSLFYNPSLSPPSFSTIADMSAWLSGAANNGSATPYNITLAGFNLETDFLFNNTALWKLGEAFNGKYVTVDLRDCTGTFLPSSNPNFSNNNYLVSILLPDSLTSIGNLAFFNCRSLTSVDLPDSLTSIGDDAFYGCSSLTSVDLPDSLTSIGAFAFIGCGSLTSVDLPDSLTSIGEYAFSGCSSLISITCNAVSPPVVGTSFLNGVSSSISIKVPAGSVAAYKAANGWKDYANNISAQ